MHRRRPGSLTRELAPAIVITAVLIALSPPSFAADPPCRSPSSSKVPEFAEMLWAILKDGADMGPPGLERRRTNGRTGPPSPTASARPVSILGGGGPASEG